MKKTSTPNKSTNNNGHGEVIERERSEFTSGHGDEKDFVSVPSPCPLRALSVPKNRSVTEVITNTVRTAFCTSFYNSL